MARAARMIEGHLEGILAHWTQGLTTAFMEGINSLFSAVKRKARGYRSVGYRTTVLYFVAGKLTVPCYFQWAARASKIGKRLGGFLPRSRLIPEIDGNCSGGREKV